MKGKASTMNFYKFYKKFGLYTILVLVFIFFSIFAPHFFSVANFINILRQVSIFGTAVIGAAIVMIAGQCDMSVGGLVAMGGIVAATAMTEWGLPIWATVLLTVVLCCVMGLLNGWLTVTFFIPGFISTLGMMLVLNGLAYVTSGGYAIFGLPSGYAFLGQGYVGPIPVPVIVFVIVCFLGTFLMTKTYFGRSIYALGGNPNAANLAGIDVKKLTMIAYVLCGFTASLAALMQLSRSNSAQPGVGADYPFDCMSAAVLGGISMSGGKGKIYGAIVGVLIIGILNNGLQLMGCDANLVDVVKGAILIFAVGIDCFYNNKGATSARIA